MKKENCISCNSFNIFGGTCDKLSTNITIETAGLSEEALSENHKAFEAIEKRLSLKIDNPQTFSCGKFNSKIGKDL